MAQSLKNTQARIALEGKIKTSLHAANFFRGIVSVWAPEFDPACHEALKSLGEWMREEDIRDFIMREALTFCIANDVDIAQVQKEVPELLSEPQIDELAGSIVAELATIPKLYDVRLPLPYVALGENVSITADVRLISFASKGVGQPAQSFLELKGEGFANYDRTQSAIRGASSCAKVVFMIGSIYKLFSNGGLKIPTYNAITNTQSKLVHSARVMERSTDSDETHATLSVGLSQYLERIHVRYSADDDQDRRNLTRVSVAVDLILNPSIEKNVVSIRRALEWAFDAETDEDPTTSFIKTCIGLEALLADQEDGVGITSQLADRCAYVLHRTAVTRAETRTLVKNIYQLRSKIVHGNVTSISHQNANLVAKASTMLLLVLQAEINAVVEWATSNRHASSPVCFTA
jgi:hypothetical protein